jgi:hypothetical protein
LRSACYKQNLLPLNKVAPIISGDPVLDAYPIKRLW